MARTVIPVGVMRSVRSRSSNRATGGTDIYAPAKRSALMARVRSRNTSAESRVQEALATAGFRCDLHRGDLPGCPDIVLAKQRIAVFVHGCFWHQHGGCAKGSLPKQNAAFWQAKLDANRRRDRRVRTKLRGIGWRTMVVWECRTRDLESFLNRVRRVAGVRA